MINISSRRKTYEFFLKHWFLTAVLLTLTGHWFAFIRLFGKNLELVNEKGELAGVSLVVCWIAWIVSLVFALLKSRSDKYNDELKNNGQFVLDRMLQCVDSVKKGKLRRFCKYIEDNHDNRSRPLEPFRHITQPTAQIERILENIQISLAQIFGISRNDIGLSLIYRTDTQDTWRFLHTINIDNDLGLDELIENSCTSARQVMDRKAASVFFADKKTGIQRNQYVPGKKDAIHDGIGSVICRDVSVDHRRRFVSAVLSITTYGKQLCEESDHDAKKKIEGIILPSFEYRIQLELALFYIKSVLAEPRADEQSST